MLMRFLPSKNHGELNGRTYDPEHIAGAAMFNPHYRNLRPGKDRTAPWALPTGADVEDSGAFQERDMATRLSADAALDRQLAHERLIAAEVPPALLALQNVERFSRWCAQLSGREPKRPRQTGLRWEVAC